MSGADIDNDCDCRRPECIIRLLLDKWVAVNRVDPESVRALLCATLETVWKSLDSL